MSMNIYRGYGTKVIYTGKNGYDSDKEHADKYLRVGHVYTVYHTTVYDWETRVKLVEVPDQCFNSVHFEESPAKCPKCGHEFPLED